MEVTESLLITSKEMSLGRKCDEYVLTKVNFEFTESIL